MTPSALESRFKIMGVIFATVFSTTVIVATILFVVKGTESEVHRVNGFKEKIKMYETQERRLACIQKTIEISYPISTYEARYYSIIFDDYSKKYNIPWEIYPALIRIESNFKPDLASPAGAKGLTQVLEGTAKMMADTLGIRYEPNRTLWNEFLNIAIGFNYFSQGVEEKDSLPAGLKHAIKRYLGGPSYPVMGPNNQVYLGEYQTTIEKEFHKLQYIYAGVVAESMGINTEKPVILSH